MDLFNLSPARGAVKKKRRLGRGEASGVGKTSGRGGKGQTARSGGRVRPGFEGGQMPLYRRIPKFGFRSRKQSLATNEFDLVNLDVLESFNKGDTVDPAALAERLGRTLKYGRVKVLGRGELGKSLTLKVHAISEPARKKVEAAGGSVEILS